MIIHGYVRNTSDIEVVVSNDPKNVTRCLDALDDFGFGGPGLRIALRSDENDIVRMGVEPMNIEILNYLNDRPPNALHQHLSY